MKGTTILKVAVLVLAAVFLVHQGVSALYKPIKTETAVYDTVSEGLRITGVILRNETPVTSDKAGVMHFLIEDGGHVAKDGAIANIYDNESASITLSRLTELTGQLNELKELLNYNDLEAADLDMLSGRVDDALDKLVLSGSSGDYADYEPAADALLSAINKRQAALGETENFSAQLKELQSEVDSLSASLPAAKGTVKAGCSGYFVSKTDGYEKVLSCDHLESITPAFLNDIAPEEISNSVVGKIVSDYRWYIAANMTVNESLGYKEGDALTIYTSVKSYPQLSVTVERINLSEDSSSAVVLFACDDMNSELATMRTGPMTVVKKEYSGLKVARSALRVVDSVKGVYVLSGIQAKFVPVDILYSNDSYMICDQQTTTEDHLRLYDEVIVKGKRLYDGKIVS